MDERQLCPDGDCIGLIGPDGHCKECGLAASEDEDQELGDGEEDFGDEDDDGEDDDDFDDDEDGDEDDDDLDEGADLELSHRELCPDGDCIGVIGPDGQCKECGTPGRSARLDPRQRGMLTEREMAGGDDDDGGEDEDDDIGPDPDLDDRQLCPDGGCIGVIGPDGQCKECGEPAPIG